MSSVGDWFDKELCWISGHSYQIIESSFSQKFYYASLRDRLKESLQWVNCVVLITTLLQHCAFQEYVLNCQSLATMLASSWWSSGQDMGFCGWICTAELYNTTLNHLSNVWITFYLIIPITFNRIATIYLIAKTWEIVQYKSAVVQGIPEWRYYRHISKLGFPILVKRHLHIYTETTAWDQGCVINI